MALSVKTCEVMHMGRNNLKYFHFAYIAKGSELTVPERGPRRGLAKAGLQNYYFQYNSLKSSIENDRKQAQTSKRTSFQPVGI